MKHGGFGRGKGVRQGGRLAECAARHGHFHRRDGLVVFVDVKIVFVLFNEYS